MNMPRSFLPVLPMLALTLWSEEPVAPPDPPGFPAAELNAAETDWKLAGAGARARLAGPAGQTDLFWELLRLAEQEPKAREDARLLRILEWLVFETPLQQDHLLADPLYTRLPSVAPKLGARLLDARLRLWLRQGAPNGGGPEPWRWPEFRNIDPVAMREAAQRLFESAPKNNPVVRVHLAATLLACGVEGARERFVEAQAGLARDLPHQANQVTAALLLGMAGCGCKPALRLGMERALLDLEGASKDHPYKVMQTVIPLFQAMGWKVPADQKNLAPSLKEGLAWLERHEAGLEFDPQTRRFKSSAPPPGYEELFALAKSLEQRYGARLLEPQIGPEFNLPGLAGELLKLMAGKAEAAQDKDAEALVLAIANHPAYGQGGDLTEISGPLERIRLDLAAKVCAISVNRQLAHNPGREAESVLSRTERMRDELATRVLELIREDFRREAEKALQAQDRPTGLEKMLGFLLLGGALPLADVEALADNLPPDWGEERGRKLGGWNDRLLAKGRVAGLVVLLKRARITAVRKEIRQGLLASFAQATGWPAPKAGFGDAAAAEKLLATYREWLLANYAKLRWDAETRRFRGGEIGPDSPVIHLVDAVAERFGVPLAYNSGDWNSAQRCLSALLDAGEKNPELAKDDAVVRMLELLAEDPQLQRNQALLSRLYLELPRQHRPAGLALWSKAFGAAMDAVVQDNSNLSSTQVLRLMQGDPGFDAALLMEARTQAEAAFRERLKEQAGKNPKLRTRMALAGMAFGGPTSPEELTAFLHDFRNEHLVGTWQVNQWHEQVLKQHNPAGLALLLIETRFATHMLPRSLVRFDELIGIKSKHEQGISTHRHEPKARARLNWLEENFRFLAWNQEQGIFVLDQKAGGKPFVEGAAANPPPDSVKPPKPPDDHPEF